MRLLVCGSRTWGNAPADATDEQRARAVIERRRGVDEILALAPSSIVHGGAEGGDECGDLAAQRAGSPINGVCVYRANWSRDGKSAGPRRNARMLAEGKPDRGLAFGALWQRRPATAPETDEDYRRTGTGDMVHKMLRAGLPVRWVATHDAVAVELVAMPEPPR